MNCASPSYLLDAIIYLKGPANDLDNATMIIWHPELSGEEAALYMVVFVNSALPGWLDAPEWLSSNVRAAQNGRRPSTNRNGLEVLMDWDEDSLIIEILK